MFLINSFYFCPLLCANYPKFIPKVCGWEQEVLFRLSEVSRFLWVDAVLTWVCILNALLLEHCTNMEQRHFLCIIKEVTLLDEKHRRSFLGRLSDEDLALSQPARKQLHPDAHNGQ